MKTPTLRSRLLAAALVGLTATAAAPCALAQEDDDVRSRSKRATAISGGAAAASERARQKREEGKKAEAQPAMFPSATRQSPKPGTTPGGGKRLQALVAKYDAKDFAGVEEGLKAVVAASDANAYEKSFAYQVAASAAADASNDAKAIEYYKQALASDGLDNNGHYQVMHNLAVVQFQADDHAGALATLDRFLAETQSTAPEYQSLRAAVLAQLGRTAEASAIYEGLLAKNPRDKSVLMNTVALYQQADNYAKANQLLAAAFAQGLLDKPSEYRALYVGYITANQFDEAMQVIDKGMAAGVLKPSPDLAKDYAYMAQNAYGQGKVQLAVDVFKRAAPMAADGEVWLNLARVYSNEKRVAEAKDAARQAVAKGIKRPEDAQRILALPGK
jgi:tetratricopeptide (TPR) repeat protein